METKNLFKQGAPWSKLQTSYPQGNVRVTSGSTPVTFGTLSGRLRDDSFCNESGSRVAREWLKVAAVFLLIFTLGVGNAWGTEYTYTAFTTTFVKGTTNGTNISTGISTSTNTSTLCPSNGNVIFTANPTAASNSYYNASGAGLRISKSNGAGSIKFTLTNALKDSSIYAIVIYASKVSGNTKAKLDITPTGPATNGYTTVTNIANGTLPAYDATNYPASSQLSHYKLDTIKVNGKKIETLQFASASGGYTMLHAVTLITQTEKPASTYTVEYADGITGGTVSADKTTNVSANETVTLTATPSTGYEFTSWDVYKKGDSSTKVTVTNNQFTMPAYDVVVNATFTASSSTCDDPTGTSLGTTTHATEGLGSQVVNWTGAAANYEIYDNTTGTAPVDQTSATINGAKTFTMTNLAPGTWYWWVRAKCSESLKSDWVSGGNFTINGIKLTGIETTPTPHIDFGTKIQGESVDAVNIKVTGVGLLSSSTITHSFDAATPFTATPASLAYNANKANLTITPSTATVGEFSRTLTITNGTYSQTVTITMNVVAQDKFIDALQNSTGYEAATPHTETGTYTTPSLSDKTVATTGTCEQTHYHFVGWITKAKYDAGTAIADADLQTPTTASNTTYYAVWAEQGSGSGSASYKKVTSTAEITSNGRYLIVYEAGTVAFDGAHKKNSVVTLDDVSNTVSTGTITNNAFSVTTDLENAEFVIDVTNKTLKSKSGYYIGHSAYANALSQNASSSWEHATFTIDNSGNFIASIQIPETLAIQLKYNNTSGQTRFRYYKSGQQDIQLYKYDPGVTYTDYLAACVACTADPTVGNPSISTSFTLTSLTGTVGVGASVDEGTGCKWEDMGLVWGTTSSLNVETNNKKVVDDGTSGHIKSFSNNVQPSGSTIPNAWAVGTTYYVRTYGKNSNPDGDYVYSTNAASFTLRSVTFVSNGGSDVGPWYVNSGGSYAAPTAPTRSNFTFDGWYTDEDLTTPVSWPVTISENKTYYAKWSCDHQVTVTWSAPQHGNIAVYQYYGNQIISEALSSGAVIDNCRQAQVYVVCTPDPGYCVSSHSATNSQASTGTNNILFFYSVGTTLSSVITITFAPAYTVTWKKNGTALSGDDLGTGANVASTLVEQNHSITKMPPTPTSCDATSTTFIGWVVDSENWSDKTDDVSDKTIYTEASQFPAVTANVIYHAVFAEASGSGSPHYAKVTSTGDITNGDYLIVYETGSVAFDGSLTTMDATGNKISVTISDYKITANSTINASKFTIDVTNKYIKSASNKYINRDTYDNGLAGNDAATSVHSISIDGSGNLVVEGTGVSGSDYVTLKYNANSDQLRFRFYKSGQQDIQLYKYDAGASYSNYLTTCCENYAVTLTGNGVVSGGTFGVSSLQPCVGNPVTLSATLCSGYTQGAWSVVKTADPTVTVSVSNNQFTMPSYPVTVSLATTAKVDYFIDRMHATTGYTGEGASREGCNYTVPNLTNTATPVGSNCDETHYIFVGWVDSEHVGSNGALLTGYNIISGNSVQNATGTTYYAIWAQAL